MCSFHSITVTHWSWCLTPPSCTTITYCCRGLNCFERRLVTQVCVGCLSQFLLLLFNWSTFCVLTLKTSVLCKIRLYITFVMFSCLWILTKMIWQCLKIICFVGSYSFYALLDSDQPIVVCDVADRDVAPWWTNSQHWTGKGASYPPVSAAGQVDQKSQAWLGSQQRGVCFGLTTPPLTPSAGLGHPDSPHPARCCSGCLFQTWPPLVVLLRVSVLTLPSVTKDRSWAFVDFQFKFSLG